jgi:hypothetical protein
MGKPVDDQVIASQCVNPRFTVLVRPYLFGQFRIQICDRAQPDPHAPEWGSIVRELYTYYNREVLARIICIRLDQIRQVAMAGCRLRA